MESLLNKILIASIVMFLSITVNAEIYKWVDKHGQTHYGEKPPENNKSKQFQLRNEPAPSVSKEKTVKNPAETKSRLEKQQKLIRALSDDRKQKKEDRDKKQRMAKQRVRNCANSKDNLRRYQSSSSVYKVDDKGNRVTLPGAERDKSIQRARDEVKKWCGK